MERVHVAGGWIEYEWVGDTDSTSPIDLVFLHEGLGCAAMWGRFPDVLAREVQCRALVYSRFGYGGSDALGEPRGDDFMHREALHVLPELLGSLGARNPILIGQSDGSSIAIIYAASFPGTTGLVLEAPHVFAEAITVQSVAAIGARFADDATFRHKFGRFHRDAAEVVRTWSEAWLAPSFGQWTIEALLPAISCPVLTLQAEHDPYGSLEHVRRIERSVSGPVRSVVLPGDGHAPHRDCRNRTFEETTRFIDAVRASVIG